MPATLDPGPHAGSTANVPLSVVLRTLRELRGLTQEGWAAALGYSAATVRRWENGGAVPPADVEDLLIEQCVQRGLLRTYTSGPLRGMTLSPELLRAILADARVRGRKSAAHHDEPTGATPAHVPAVDAARDVARGPELPVPLTGLIGRDTECATIYGLLNRNRLITLTGPGGSGKTRIALEVARTLTAQLGGHLAWVDLASLNDPALVLSAIAQAVGVRETSGHDLVLLVCDFLRDDDWILVLDNFEHLLSARQIVAELLHKCARLRILATSRARLHIYGEYEFPIPTLPLPAESESAAGVPLAGLAAYPAIALFVERVQQAGNPGFELTVANSPAIVAICRRLDGLPLAIELAAARTKILTPEAILARLNLRVLVGGAADTPARHQTLTATLDWSYGLLDRTAQHVLRWLGVFAGGCSVDSVEALFPESDEAVPVVLDQLQALVDESLLRHSPHADGEPRFTMLETIREYALDRLSLTGELEEVRRRHAAYFLQLVERAEPELVGAHQAIWLERLDWDRDNIRAALQWSIDSNQPEMGIRLAAALWRYWELRGYLSEGQSWLEKGLVRADVPNVSRAKALTAAGALACVRGDYRHARELHDESLRLFRALDNKPGIARSLSNLGVVAKEQGDYASATALYQESLAIRRQLQDTWSIAALQINLGEIAREQGDLAQAESAYRESLRLFETRGDDVGKAVAFNNLGELARERLDYEAAIDFHNKSLNLREKNRDTLGIARSRTKLAKLYSLKANYSEAAQHLADSLARCKQAGAEQDLLCCLQDVAELVFAFGSPRQSLPLLAATQDLRTKLGLSSSKEQQSESQQMLIAMQSMFDDATLTELRDQGSNMTFAQATEYGASIVNDIQIAARYINPALHDASTNVVLSRSG